MENGDQMSNIFLILTCIIAFLGLIGNGCMIASHLKKSRQVRFNLFMVTLGTFDSIYLLFSVAWITRFYWGEFFTYWQWFYRDEASILEYFKILIFGCSIYSSLMIATDRFMILRFERFVVLLH